MKRLTTMFLVITLMLCGCTAGDKNWMVTTSESTEHIQLSADELCASYAAVQAKFWQREAGQWQLSIIEAPAFVVSLYIADKTYEITAPDMDTMKEALQEYPCSKQLDEILAEEPYLWFANTSVENPDDDGWGEKEVLGYTLPWPASATDLGEGWMMDDVKFQVTNISTQDSAEEDLKVMSQTLEESEVEDATILYYQDATYQGLAFRIGDTWDISLARFDNQGSIYLSLVGQPDFSYAKEIANRYSMGIGMQALEIAEPYYSK